MTTRMAGFAPAAALLLAAIAQGDTPLLAAERHLLSGDPNAALRVLEGSTPRRLRLEADAHVALHDRQALQLLEALAKHPGWEQHARRQTSLFMEAEDRKDRVRLGSMLFALTLGLLILAGARELLRLRIEAIVIGIALLVVVLLVRRVSEPLMNVAGVLAIAGAALVHAGTAAVRRTMAEARIRLMIAVTMLLGFAGAIWAVLNQIRLGGLFALLARG